MIRLCQFSDCKKSEKHKEKLNGKGNLRIIDQSKSNATQIDGVSSPLMSIPNIHRDVDILPHNFRLNNL